MVTAICRYRGKWGYHISQQSQIIINTISLSRYERGLANPSIDVVQKITMALDASIDQLVLEKNKI
ncbi:MAG: helix-turn-helix transcriptional regulator [Bacteroidales bacterium]|nr:helix-turn-helix transcriptional regulator [Bacteroidales bacterium]